MSKQGFAKARQLIRDKKYHEARSVLEGIDHPKATEWILRIDKLTSQRRISPANIIAGIATVSVSIMVIVAIAVLTSGLSSDELAATAIAEIRATLDEFALLEYARVSATYTTYCSSVAERNKGDCDRWALTVLDTLYDDALLCDTEYDWITDTNDFTTCLFLMGISPMGSSAVIDPVKADTLSSADISEITGLDRYCSGWASDEFCRIWSIAYFVDKPDYVAGCLTLAPPDENVLTFTSCLQSRGPASRR